jgi:Restriction endonuclease S subunits
VKSVFEERSERSGVGEMISVTINRGVVPASSLDRKDNSSEDRSNYKVVKQCDIAYNSMRMWQGASGVSRYEGIVSPAYTILKPIEGANSNFFGNLFKTNKMIQTFQKHSQGLTSDTWNLKYPALSEIQNSYPNSKDEQANVTKLFEALDNLIAANQRKLESLKDEKKAYLERIFNQKLRFSGFHDPWLQPKLSHVLTERSEKAAQSDEYPLVSFTVESGVTPKTERYDREQLVRGDKKSKEYKKTVLDDIVYNTANLKFGAINRNKYGNAVFSPIYITFEVDKSEMLPMFAEIYVTRSDFIQRSLKYQQGTVYERQSVSPEALLSMPVTYPALDEQQRIGRLFDTLDRLIDARRQKINQLQNQKEAYLQKMFI